MLLKIHSLVIPSHSPFSSSLALSPSVERSFSQWYLGFFVSFHFILLAWGVILCLYLSLFTLFHLSFCVSIPLSPLPSQIWHGTETGERLLCFWHTLPLLKSKPTELKSGYYLSWAASLSLSPNLPHLLKVYEILHFEKKGQSYKRVGRKMLHK